MTELKIKFGKLIVGDAHWASRDKTPGSSEPTLFAKEGRKEMAKASQARL